jgi:hypothetical protein
MTNFPTERALSLLRKSRSGCRDCKLRKVKVSRTFCSESSLHRSCIPQTSVTKWNRFARIVADAMRKSSIATGAQKPEQQPQSIKRLAVRQPSEHPTVQSPRRGAIGKSPTWFHAPVLRGTKAPGAVWSCGWCIIILPWSALQCRTVTEHPPEPCGRKLYRSSLSTLSWYLTRCWLCLTTFSRPFSQWSY